jgi:cytosine/adenosine deaminase-related metal-dependent hydrolase
MDASRRIIQDGSVLIDGQRIRRVGKTAELSDVPADQVIDAREMVVTPGFCNNHMHISYAHAVRGIFPDDLDPGVYLANVFKLQGAMNEEDEYYTSLLGITELLKYGTTCFLDPGSTKFLDACMQAYEEPDQHPGHRHPGLHHHDGKDHPDV